MRTLSIARALIVLFGVSIAIPLAAQTTSSTILGRISDSTDAAIPDVTVQLTNQATGIAQAVKTNGSGNYIFPDIRPGIYRIQAKRDRFEAIQISDIQVAVAATVRKDITLRIGSVEQQMTVVASAPVITTDSGSLGNVVDDKQLTSLPVNGRTVDRFIQLTAGNAGGNGGQPRIGGAIRDGGAFFSVDGVPYQDVALGRAASNAIGLGQLPSVDSVQELKIQSSIPDAEYEGSVAIIMLTKGGGNAFHGSLFEFNQNRAYAARPFFSQATTPKPQFNRNEFGGVIGGPIVKNRTFFLFDYEGLRQRTALSTALSVPTGPMRNGDFTGLGNIIDPAAGASFQGSMIPASRINPIASQLQGYLPLPNAPGTGPAGTGINYYGITPQQLDEDRYTLRFDHLLTAKTQITANLNYANSSPTVGGSGTTPANFGNLADTGRVTKSAGLAVSSALRPTLLNEFRYSYFMNREIYIGQNLGFDPTRLFPGLLGPLSAGGLPTVQITGFQGLSDYGAAQGLAPQITNQFLDNVTIVAGRHQIKTGILFAMVRQSRPTNVNPPALGQFSFNGRYTGNAYADFLLGDLVSSARAQQSAISLLHYWRMAGFIQDDWRVSSRFTLNLGLRYEYQSAPLERDGSMSNFDLATHSFVVRTVDGNYPRTAVPQLLNAYPIKKSEEIGWGSDLMLADTNGYGPRIGFAWRPFSDSRTVVRGGYGIFQALYYHGLGLFGTFFANPPFFLSQTFEAASGTTPSLNFSNPFPGTGSIAANPTILAVQRQLRLPYSQQWNFTIERELAPNLGLRVSYVGNKATHIDRSSTNWNLPPTQTPGTIQSHRPYQPWGDINSLVFDGSATTHQLQIEVTHRQRAGLTWQSSYSWTKSLDNVPANGLTQNPYDTSADRGNADGIRHHVWNNSVLYELPLGPNRKFFSSTGPVRYLTGGWSIGSFFQLLSGTPFSVTFTPTQAGWYATRADAVAGANPYPANSSASGWFNPAAFAVPQPFTFGNSGRNALIGPGQISLDVNVTKNFAVRERFRAEFRAESFNLPNHVSLGNPSANISVPATVGLIRSSTVSARVVQFGLKLHF